MLGDDAGRKRLQNLAKELHEIISSLSTTTPTVSHIQPLMVGDAHKALEISERLNKEGIVVLPIRTPTVPVGTERLRFSLSANLTDENMNHLKNVLKKCVNF